MLQFFLLHAAGSPAELMREVLEAGDRPREVLPAAGRPEDDGIDLPPDESGDE